MHAWVEECGRGSKRMCKGLESREDGPLVKGGSLLFTRVRTLVGQQTKAHREWSLCHLNQDSGLTFL